MRTRHLGSEFDLFVVNLRIYTCAFNVLLICICFTLKGYVMLILVIRTEQLLE